MPKIHADPEHLLRFAQFLGELAERLRAAKTRSDTAFCDLHEVWRDEKFHRFHGEYEQASKHLDQFLHHTELYREYLRRKAQPLIRYLEQR